MIILMYYPDGDSTNFTFSRYKIKIPLISLFQFLAKREWVIYVSAFANNFQDKACYLNEKLLFLILCELCFFWIPIVKLFLDKVFQLAKLVQNFFGKELQFKKKSFALISVQNEIFERYFANNCCSV